MVPCACGCGTLHSGFDARGRPRRFVSRGHASRRPLKERLLAKVTIANTGCWLWQGHLDDCGYGRIGLKGANRHAHRVAYELFVGPVPEGLELDHLCRNRNCVNPEHTEPVTHQENMARGNLAARTHCSNGHEFTEENTFYRTTEGNGRRCRICQREYRRRSSARRLLSNERAEASAHA